MRQMYRFYEIKKRDVRANSITYVVAKETYNTTNYEFKIELSLVRAQTCLVFILLYIFFFTYYNFLNKILLCVLIGGRKFSPITNMKNTHNHKLLILK